MTSISSTRLRLGAALSLATLASALGAATDASLARADAGAAPGVAFGCDASALRGTVLGGAVLEPVTANRGQAACHSAASGLPDLLAGLGLPLPILAGVAGAQTTAEGAAGSSGQSALAVGGLVNLDIKALPTLPISLPLPDLSPYANVGVPLPAPLPTLLGALGFTGALHVDLRPALQALLPANRLPSVSLLHLQTALASAAARCVDGQPQLSGSAEVAGLSVLGVSLPTDQLVSQVLTLINSVSVDPSAIDLTKVALPAPLSSLSALPLNVGSLLTAAIHSVLATLPPLQIPATLANLSVTPAGQTRTGDSLTRQAVHVALSLLGQSLVDLVVGEARVSDAGAGCSSPTAGGPATATQLELQCTTRKLTLVDVLPQGDHVQLLGAADRRYIGQRVALVFGGARTVAHAVVAPDGSFSAQAPMPPRTIRETNQARYQAAIGSERSLDLKLARRMRVTTLASRAGMVTIAGRITRPLVRPPAPITLTRRVSCSQSAFVARFRPAADGRFSVTVPAPRGLAAAVYRLQTRVPKTLANPRVYPTFTLPRAVDLLG